MSSSNGTSEANNECRHIETRLFIDGNFVASTGGATLPITNPATEAHVVDVFAADAHDVDLAVDAASRAAAAWGTTDASVRAGCLRRLAELVMRNVEELAYLESISMGKPVGGYDMECAGVAAILEYYAGALFNLHGETSLTSVGLMKMSIRQPFGVCAAIIPWNMPVGMFCMKLGPAMAAGNTLIIKSSEKAPLTSIKMAELANLAGFPPGVVNVITGYGATAGAALASHMKVRKISFTGSAPTGRLIQKAAADSNLKDVTLELGGKSPCVVFDDADIDIAVEASYRSIAWNTGQTCMANTRLFVHNNVAEEFTQKFLKSFASVKCGDPLNPATTYGPVADKAQFTSVMRYIDTGKREGGELLLGGNRATSNGSSPSKDSREAKGYYISPTVFANVPETASIAKEEIFGPVVNINVFTTESEVLRMCNDTEYGLYAAVFTKDLERAIRFVRGLEAGTVGVNVTSPVGVTPDMPFGGWKQSGNGREYAMESLHHWSEVKTVVFRG